MVLPSEKLLSEVYGQEVDFIKYVANNTYEVWFSNPVRLKYQIVNIYELMHMMKEYIKSQNLMIIVYNHLDTVAVEIVQNQKSIYTSPGMSVYTEPEAVTKACEWILEQQK